MLVKSQVKYIQSLGHKKYRDQDAVFIAEGPKLIQELLHAPHVQPVMLFAVDEWMEMNRDLLRTLQRVQLVPVKEQELDRISFLSKPNQVLGVFKKPSFPEIKAAGRISLLLDGIQDPGNLGTIVRIADWFGLLQIICSEDCADVFNPKVVQASMGSLARVQVCYTSLPGFLEKQPAIPVYAMTLEGEDVLALKPIREGLIVVGNESKGISNEMLKMTGHRISIPRIGAAESLNAAVAAGIVLAQLTAKA